MDFEIVFSDVLINWCSYDVGIYVHHLKLFNWQPLGGRKRKRTNTDKDMGKPKEVIYVRAKRGQATDSHSLAERVRIYID